MKTIVTTGMMIICTGHVLSQSAQIRIYLQQIAANRVLIEYTYKGYQIAKNGLWSIGDIRQGEYNLHRDYFGSLKAINPSIKKSAMAAELVSRQAGIIRTCQSGIRRIRTSGALSPNEANYLEGIFENVLRESARKIHELLTLLTADQYQLSDDKRISRIGALSDAMQSDAVFARRSVNNARVLAAQRQQELREAASGLTLYGISTTP